MDDNTPKDPNYQVNDSDKALRPKKLEDFTGQSSTKENLAIFIESARKRGLIVPPVPAGDFEAWFEGLSPIEKEKYKSSIKNK